MAKYKRSSVIIELRLLDVLERESDRATETIVAAACGGPKAYERYFGENGALVRKRREILHPITGLRIIEYDIVSISWDGNKKLHGRTEFGKRYQKFLRESLLFWGPYAEAAGGRLRRGEADN